MYYAVYIHSPYSVYRLCVYASQRTHVKGECTTSLANSRWTRHRVKSVCFFLFVFFLTKTLKRGKHREKMGKQRHIQLVYRNNIKKKKKTSRGEKVMYNIERRRQIIASASISLLFLSKPFNCRAECNERLHAFSIG